MIKYRFLPKKELELYLMANENYANHFIQSVPWPSLWERANTYNRIVFFINKRLNRDLIQTNTQSHLTSLYTHTHTHPYLVILSKKTKQTHLHCNYSLLGKNIYFYVLNKSELPLLNTIYTILWHFSFLSLVMSHSIHNFYIFP